MLYEPPENDTSIGPGWFRFEGDAGLMMTTSCPPKDRCNTAAPGWLRADVSKYRPEVYKSEKSKILKKIHKVALGKLLT